jgi:hypothetical protein
MGGTEMRRITLLAGLILFLSLGAAGCGSTPGNSQSLQNHPPPVIVGRETFVRVSYDQLPQEVKRWVDISREMNLAQEKVVGNKRYILVTYGTKPTGGYAVEITHIETSAATINVVVKFTQPTRDQYVNQALTQPYDIVYIEPSDRPLEFFPFGDEFHIMTLFGIDELSPIVASSPGIKVFSPAPGEITGGEVKVSGVASVGEGLFFMSLEDEEGKSWMEAAFTMGSLGDWGYFETLFAVPDPIPYGSNYTLVITENASSGKEEKFIKIPLKK